MATHLAASMRVVASIEHRRRVSIADAAWRSCRTAERVESGLAGPDTLLLVERLEKWYRFSGITELARFAEGLGLASRGCERRNRFLGDWR
jgi:hypothetical protein